MKEINITPDQLERAKELYDFKALSGSITNGGGNITGALGEIIVVDLFGDRVNSTESTRHYDMIIDGWKIDVKAIRTKVKPKPDYDCELTDKCREQMCDFFFWLRILNDYSTAWLLGYISREEYFKVAKFYKKGDPNPDRPAFKFKHDDYVIKISQLHKFNKIITQS